MFSKKDSWGYVITNSTTKKVRFCQLKKMTKLIFLGAPGAGKGTQAQILSQNLGIPHISTGEILRGAIADETPLGIKAKGYVDNGDLVPDELILDLIKERLGQEDAQKGWILDGFPRNVPQADFLKNLLQELNQVCNGVVNLDVPDSVLLERLLSRGRKDDNEATISNRVQVYRQQTAPLIDYYQQHQLLINVNGHRELSQISEELETIVKS
jgi:adenylate kinase